MLNIRKAKAADAAALVAIYAPYVNETTITFDYEQPSVEEFSRKIAETASRYPFFVAEEAGEILGYTYAHAYKERAAYDWVVEVSVYVKRSKQAKGIGRQLYQSLEATLKKQNVAILTACITGGNEESIRFHEKFGYQQVGFFPKIGYKFEQWQDILWFQKNLVEPIGKLPAFIPFGQLE